MAESVIDDLAQLRKERAAAWKEQKEQTEQVLNPEAEQAPLESREAPESSQARQSPGVAEPQQMATAEPAVPEPDPTAAPTAGNGVEAMPACHDEMGSRCCRICYDTSETAETGRLFSPCRCDGSARFVHVACLNSWRASSSNQRSYYRCDTCHYEYRLQRLWLADVLLSHSVQLSLTIILFLVGALVVGLMCHFAAPWVVDWALGHLRLQPSVRFFFTEQVQVQGNPACWHGGYTYRLCCGRGHPGNPKCWDDVHSFESCCEGPPQMLQWLQAFLVRPLRVLLGGGTSGMHRHEHAFMCFCEACGCC